jgi:hypothetical protein
MDDDRVENFLRAVLSLEGQTLARVRDNVRFHISECAKMFRRDVVDERKKDEAALDGNTNPRPLLAPSSPDRLNRQLSLPLCRTI